MIPKRIPEEEFKYIYSKVPRLCVDIIIQSDHGVILSKRMIPPFKGMWHIPGGTVLNREKLEATAKRVALEELGLDIEINKLLGLIEYPEMDDEKHAVSIAYLITDFSGTPRGSNQGKEVKFFQELPENLIPAQKEFLEEHLEMK
ncbi:MAG: NUDIX domain-containing protein [Candidatus Daviesbacteria bacterium]|nr:NUDIX domain-containing protein [Candidatus Daviesbacteria bacterium]